MYHILATLQMPAQLQGHRYATQRQKGRAQRSAHLHFGSATHVHPLQGGFQLWPSGPCTSFVKRLPTLAQWPMYILRGLWFPLLSQTRQFLQARSSKGALRNKSRPLLLEGRSAWNTGVLFPCCCNILGRLMHSCEIKLEVAPHHDSRGDLSTLVNSIVACVRSVFAFICCLPFSIFSKVVATAVAVATFSPW